MKEFKIAMLGMVDGNGHPYSWSAMFNGYDKEEMDKYEKEEMKKYGLELGLQEGLKEGLKEGLQEGLKQGRAKLNTIIENMISKGMNVAEVSELTNITEDEINSLLN